MREWQASRKNRRNVKGLIGILADLINVIPYKNYANALPILKGQSVTNNYKKSHILDLYRWQNENNKYMG